MKIIIDTDPGVDDAMAIFYAHAAEDIELLGLTTVFGNVHVEQATRNALYLLELAGADVPVAQGAATPLERGHVNPSHHVHGQEGFGDVVDIETTARPIDETAAEFLVRMAREHKGELVISAIAPLTNIAEAIRLDPQFGQNVSKIVIMGGAVERAGNVTPFAEANVFHDPHAAAEIFASDCNVVLVGLDVTLKTLCTAEDFSRMAEASPMLGGFLQDIGRSYLRFYKEVAGEDGSGLHDSTALIACTHPELFETKSVPVQVVTEGDAIGQTVAVPHGEARAIDVCLGINADAVKDLFVNRVSLNP